MNVMIYVYKRDFEVQKAERFFKERGIKVQLVDMKKKGPGLKELKLFAQKVALHNLIDRQSTAYLEHPVRFMTGESTILDALVLAPQLLKSPIVREGQRVTVGYQPDEWMKWIQS